MAQNSLVRSTFSFSVEVGGVAQAIYTGPEGHSFIEAIIGQPYVLVVKNLTGGRIEVVTSVDGLNTLQNEVAAWSNRGLVLFPYRTGRFTGWQLNDKEATDFVFVDPISHLTVAQQVTGSDQNLGVIGVAVFTEKERYRPTMPLIRNDRFQDEEWLGRATTKSLSVRENSDVGTGMGKTHSNPLGKTTFERNESVPLSVSVQYRTRNWLERNGVLKSDFPSAFPDDTTDTGYGKFKKVSG